MTNEWKKIIFCSAWVVIVCMLFIDWTFLNLWIVLTPYIIGFLILKNNKVAELISTGFWLGFSMACFLNITIDTFVWWLIALPAGIIYNIYRDKQTLDMEAEVFKKLSNPKE